MARFVLSDSAPLICLAQIDGLPWLEQIFGRIHITEQVREEILTGLGKPGEEALAKALRAGLIRVHPEWNFTDPAFPDLGTGEATAIAAGVNLAHRGHDCLLIIDDLEARRRASPLALQVTGTAAIVGVAKQQRLIPSAEAVFAELRAKGFRISDSIIEGILRTVGERPGKEREAPASSPVRPAKARRRRKR